MTPAETTRLAAPDDARGRRLRDLRISVTDRCNFRCSYCMPKEHFRPGFQFLPRAELLRLEEIARLAGIFAELGVEKLRITGGEPLLRTDLPKLIEQLARDTKLDLAITTNGSLLTKYARALADAGLKRATVSLDSLDDTVFAKMTDSGLSPADVLAGIDAAASAGLSPIKINCVVRRGVNDHTIVDLARHFRDRGHVVRFIEYMDVGATNGWRLNEVVTGSEIVERLSAELPLEPLEPSYRGEVAKRWRYRDGSGEIGVITSVSQPFCGDCSRARLSARGVLYTCLFSTTGTDLRGPLRDGASDGHLREIIARVWGAREDRYSELRARSTPSLPRIEMSYIGG
jgi:cyclic pyranopterin phosphate synthase